MGIARALITGIMSAALVLSLSPFVALGSDYDDYYSDDD